jgi:hypothetical protein
MNLWECLGNAIVRFPLRECGEGNAEELPETPTALFPKLDVAGSSPVARSVVMVKVVVGLKGIQYALG